MNRTATRSVDWRERGHAGWWAFAVHRVSGLALAIFLPLHFWVLGHALAGEGALDGFLRWTEQPLVKATEVGLVFLLAVHLTGGLRLLLAEFGGWRASWQPRLIAVAGGLALLCALLFALNLTGGSGS
jgi:fumarate reductase subunit D